MPDMTDNLMSDDYYANPSDEENTIAKVIDMMMSDDNIELKTDIKDPWKFSMFYALADIMDGQGLSHSAAIHRSLGDKFMRFMVSKNRKGREDVKEIASNLNTFVKEQELSRMDKMLGRGRM